jgi:integrase
VLGYAVELDILPANPIEKVVWKAPETADQVDRRVVASPRQVDHLLAAVANERPELVAFFACLYYAFLRPAEAAALTSDSCELPVIGDAVHRGWLHRLHHDQRTEAAEELARRVRAFQRDLRRLKAQGNAEALAGELLPYALHFGMAGQDTPALARFSHAFTAAFASLAGWHPSAPPAPGLRPA